VSNIALFASADALEELGIGYQMAYSGKTLRCFVIQPREWKRLKEALLDQSRSFPGQAHPIIVNNEDFREHARHQSWRLSEWQ